MRRLQSNLAYLAAIADRSHKPSSQIPAHPAIMTAPILAPKSPTDASPHPDNKQDDFGDRPDDAESRCENLRDLYRQLQALFPGVDPKKESQMMQAVNPAQRAQAQPPGAVQMPKQQQGPGPGQGQAQDPMAQQKMQNDMLRQKMMHQQQQAQQQAQQQMSQGMPGSINPQQQGQLLNR